MPTLVLFRGGEILVFFSKLNTKSHYDNVSFCRMSNSFPPPLFQIFKIPPLLCSPFFKFAGIWIEDIFLKGSIFQKNDNYDKCLDHRKLSVSVWSQQHENRRKLFKKKQFNKVKHRKNCESCQEQGGRTWQPFVRSKNGNENFRQARIYNFCVKCVVFAHNCKFAKLTQ